MKAELLLMFRRLQEFQLELHGVLNSVPSELSTDSVGDITDSGFFCREISRIADDIRKGCDARQGLIGRYLVARVGAAGAQGEGLKLDGEYATGVPDIVVKPKLPDSGTPEFIELLRWIGCSDEQIQGDMLRPSYKGIQKVLTERAATGEQPPPGISVTFTDATVVFRTKSRKTKDGNQEEF